MGEKKWNHVNIEIEIKRTRKKRNTEIKVEQKVKRKM